MPQLDKVTFLSQFFWLSFFYLGFYFLVLKYFLPKMSRLLKFRKKKMSGSEDGVNFLVSENEQIKNHFDSMIAKSLHTSRNIFNDNIHRTENWLSNVKDDTNKKHYDNLNTTYIASIGEHSLEESMTLFQLSLGKAGKEYTQLVFSKLI